MEFLGHFDSWADMCVRVQKGRLMVDILGHEIAGLSTSGNFSRFGAMVRSSTEPSWSKAKSLSEILVIC